MSRSGFVGKGSTLADAKRAADAVLEVSRSPEKQVIFLWLLVLADKDLLRQLNREATVRNYNRQIRNEGI
jgi:hypothetical protein